MTKLRRSNSHPSPHNVFSPLPVWKWENPPHGQFCKCGECRPVMARNLAMWRRRTGATRPSTPYIPKALRAAQVGTRSCYARCHKRPEGAHPECAAAHSDYQATWAMARRAGITMEEARLIREHDRHVEEMRTSA